MNKPITDTSKDDVYSTMTEPQILNIPANTSKVELANEKRRVRMWAKSKPETPQLRKES